MIKGFKFIVDGKDYSRDIKGGVQATVVKAVYQTLHEKLGDLMNDIDKEGGIIEFNQNTGRIRISGCSPQLEAKIENAMK